MEIQDISASRAGRVLLGGELLVHRLAIGRALLVLDRAIELGVNFIDTAQALCPYPDDLVIAKKGE